MNSGLKDLMRIATINPKPFEVLLCTSIDRIARDTDLVIRIHKILKKHGVEIRFAEPAEELVCDLRRWRKDCGT